MVPILTIQQRMTEVGRIRMGEKVPLDRGGSRPKRLSTFRLTSHSRGYIEQVSNAYGGVVAPWDSEQGRQWQVTIEAPSLDVLVAPAEAFSQWYEMWTGGGCARRCNGITMETRDGKDVREQEIECMCPPDAGERVDLAAQGQACKPTTRLLVWLPKLQGIGVWRAETHGFYAAAELPAAVSFLQGMYAQGFRPIASLRMSTREIKRPGQPTKQFPVLELDLPEVTLSGLLAQGMALPGEAQPVLGPGAAQAPKQIGAPRAQADWNGQAGQEVIEQAPPAPVNVSPTGTPPAARERRPRPPEGSHPDLPTESPMRKPEPAQPKPATRPAPGPAPDPMEEMLPFGQEEESESTDEYLRMVSEQEQTERENAEREAIAAAELAAEQEREAIAAAAEPTVETASGPVVAATGEIVGRPPADDGLTPEQFKGMIQTIGAQPRWVVALARDLFPEVSDFRALDDGQRGRLYNEAATRMAAAEGGPGA